MNSLIKLYDDVARANNCDFSVATAKESTTFKGGGSAGVFSPNSEKEFAQIYMSLTECGYKPIILGGGSNTIIADGFLQIPLISTRRLCNVREENGKLYAECGARISDVTLSMRRLGMSGLDFLCGVPATVGGAIRMNAGAFSQQTIDYVHEIRVLNTDMHKNGNYYDVLSPNNAEDVSCGFGYRKGTDKIVLGAMFEGERMSADKSLARSREYAAARAAKQPKQPSCGSVFKNGNVPSGKLIEDCGLKGTRIGGAQISELHANFIVNIGGAKASDFISLVELCEREVKQKFGVMLEREFVYLSNGMLERQVISS